MKINKNKIKFFKIKNRRGFAAIYSNHLTEGKSAEQAYERMLKAVSRSRRKSKKR